MMRAALLVGIAFISAWGASEAVAQNNSAAQLPEAGVCSAADRAKGMTFGPVDHQRAGPELWRLYRAAMVFAQNGQTEACERVIEGLRTYAASVETNTPPPAGTVDKRILNARPLTQMLGSTRVGEIMGMPVISLRGETLGDVDEVVFPTVAGGTPFLLVGTGGFMEFGEEYVPVRADAVRVLDERLAVPVDGILLDDAPRFTMDAIDNGSGEWAKAASAWWDRALSRN